MVRPVRSTHRCRARKIQNIRFPVESPKQQGPKEENGMLPYREPLEEVLQGGRFLVSVNYRQTAGLMAAEHWHPYGELLYLFGGEAKQVINGTQFSLHTGDCLFIQPGAVHGTTAVEECYIGVAVFFHTEPFSTMYLPVGTYAQMAPLFSRMQEESTLKKPGYNWVVQGLLWEAMGYLQRYGTVLTMAPVSSGEGAKWDEYIRTHLSETLTLESAAALAGYSPAYFSRYFTKLMGMPFKSYVDHMKMQAAKGLLRDGVSVTETAATLGYETLSSFCRAFKRLTGQAPSQYGNNNKN